MYTKLGVQCVPLKDQREQCPRCEKLFLPEELHEDDKLCSACEGEWVEECNENFPW